jgi:hypothetical protein
MQLPLAFVDPIRSSLHETMVLFRNGLSAE